MFIGVCPEGKREGREERERERGEGGREREGGRGREGEGGGPCSPHTLYISYSKNSMQMHGQVTIGKRKGQ